MIAQHMHINVVASPIDSALDAREGITPCEGARYWVSYYYLENPQRAFEGVIVYRDGVWLHFPTLIPTPLSSEVRVRAIAMLPTSAAMLYACGIQL